MLGLIVCEGRSVVHSVGSWRSGFSQRSDNTCVHIHTITHHNTKQDWLIFSGKGISCDGGTTPPSTGSNLMVALTFFLALFAAVGTLWCVLACMRIVVYLTCSSLWGRCGGLCVLCRLALHGHNLMVALTFSLLLFATVGTLWCVASTKDTHNPSIPAITQHLSIKQDVHPIHALVTHTHAHTLFFQ